MTARRTTILQIIPRLDTGGAELATIEITAAVTAQGWRALVLTEGGRLAAQIATHGGELVPFPAATKLPWRIWGNAAVIARLVRREGASLIHARSRAPAWSGLIAARRAGIPFVTTYHGAYNENGPGKRLYNSVMARGDIVIANSKYTADLIMARYGTDPARIEVIYRGLDAEAFDPAHIAPERVAQLRAAWQVAPGEKIVLQAARLTRWKGQESVIAAFARVLGNGRRDAVLVLAGDEQGRTAYRLELAALAQSLGIDNRVRFVGHVSDMAAAFAAAHVAVVGSIEPEAFGRAGVEAQAAGCPVIATRIGAPPETVLAPPLVAPDAATGWLVPPGEAGALAGAIADALDLDEPARARMAQRARANVQSRFTLSAMQDRTIAVYRRLLGMAAPGT